MIFLIWIHLPFYKSGPLVREVDQMHLISVFKQNNKSISDKKTLENRTFIDLWCSKGISKPAIL